MQPRADRFTRVNSTPGSLPLFPSEGILSVGDASGFPSGRRSVPGLDLRLGRFGPTVDRVDGGDGGAAGRDSLDGAGWMGAVPMLSTRWPHLSIENTVQSGEQRGNEH